MTLTTQDSIIVPAVESDDKRPDFFDIMTIKQSFPKVKINLIGNLHQAKVIHVI